MEGIRFALNDPSSDGSILSLSGLVEYPLCGIQYLPAKCRDGAGSCALITADWEVWVHFQLLQLPKRLMAADSEKEFQVSHLE